MNEGLDIVKEVYEAKQKDIKNYPCTSNRASEIGHPCLRYLVYNRTNWADKTMPSVELQFIFDGGNMIHQLARKQLENLSTIQLVENEASFEWKEYQITGRLDGKITKDYKTRYPIEVKGISHWDWQKINCMEDMLYSDKPWLKKYPAQLMIYMLQNNAEYGLFYLISKMTFAPKAIWMHLSDGSEYEFAESLLKKAELVNKHVKENTLPDRTDDFDICSKCPFSHICLPDLSKNAVRFNDTVLLENLTILDQNKEAKNQYEKADEVVKEMVKGKTNFMCGDFYVTGKYTSKKEFVVKAQKYWQKKVVNTKKVVDK
jgi:CRISPR/Cas system-associated exonuclease Cas4 (RecB family)